MYNQIPLKNYDCSHYPKLIDQRKRLSGIKDVAVLYWQLGNRKIYYRWFLAVIPFAKTKMSFRCFILNFVKVIRAKPCKVFVFFCEMLIIVVVAFHSNPEPVFFRVRIFKPECFIKAYNSFKQLRVYPGPFFEPPLKLFST